MYSIIFFPSPEDCQVVLLNSAFPPRVSKTLKPGWEGGGAIDLCNQGIVLLFYLTLSQNSEIDCCRSASPASPFLLSAPSVLFHSWPHKGVVRVFSCGSGSYPSVSAVLFLPMRWFDGGNCWTRPKLWGFCFHCVSALSGRWIFSVCMCSELWVPFLMGVFP